MFVWKRLIRNVPYWNEYVKRNRNHVDCWRRRQTSRKSKTRNCLFVAWLR